MAEVAVIGAGFGGLAAAISLRQQGHRVVVYEALQRAGGKAGHITVDGVTMDTGPSVLTLPWVFDRLLAPLGTSLAAEGVVLRSPSPAFRYRYADGTVLDVHHDVEDTLDSVGATLGLGARQQLDDFLCYAGQIWERAAPSFVMGPAPTPGRIARLPLRELAGLRHIDALATMDKAIAERVYSPHLRSLLLRYATYNGSDPRKAPATLNCIAHVELALGGYGVEGGMTHLVDTLVRVAENTGVTFAFSSAVERVVRREGRVAGIETNKGPYTADVVVANADTRHLRARLLGQTAPDHAPSTSGWTALLRVPRAERAPHTVVFPADYPAEFRDLFDRDRPPVDPTVYVCAQGPCHGSAGWPEHEALFVMANAPAVRPDDVVDYTELRARVLSRLAAAGIARDPEVLWARTPRDLAALFPDSLGSLYGPASHGWGAAFRREPNRVADVPGLYVASGSAHPGGGVPLAVLSGLQAATEAGEDLARRAG